MQQTQLTTKVCHLTSAHPRYDTRIFHKECRSLSAARFKTFLIVADGAGDETRDGVVIIDAGKRRTQRLLRIVFTTRRVLKHALMTRSEVFHLHDPELMPIGLTLKRMGKIVIFDAHEDFPRQLLRKHYLPSFLARSLAAFIAIYERAVCRQFDAIVAATPPIRDKFLLVNPSTIDVNNYPILDEVDIPPRGSTHDTRAVCYVGGLTTIRGAFEMINAFGLVKSDIQLRIVGKFSEPRVAEKLERLPGWARVEYLGWLDHHRVFDVLHDSAAGLVLFHPGPNHVEAQPNKMFEYMNAGIPVIASDFPRWREIIDAAECGICVDPLNPSAIALAIEYIVANPEDARRMGENGRKAVRDLYNWPIEEHKLILLYQEFTI